MTKSKQLIIGGVVGGIVALVLAFTYFSGLYTKLAGAVGIAFDPANCYITSPITGTSATTTLSYMTAGTATTTVTCGMGNDGAKSAVLVVEVNASSTATSFNIYPEESMDGVDWFPIAINQNSSSTAPYNLTQRTFYEFIFASSTVGGVGAGVGLKGASTSYAGYTALNDRNHYVLDVPTRMKQVRAYAVIPVGSAAGAVWMQIIPRKEF